MNILTDEAIKLLEDARAPVSVKITILGHRPTKWRQFLYRLLGYDVLVNAQLVTPDGETMIENLGSCLMCPGDTYTVGGLYTGMHLNLPWVVTKVEDKR